MPERGHALAEPFVQEAVPHHARGGRKVVALLSLLLGSCLAVSLHYLPGETGGEESQEPAVALAGPMVRARPTPLQSAARAAATAAWQPAAPRPFFWQPAKTWASAPSRLVPVGTSGASENGRAEKVFRASVRAALSSSDAESRAVPEVWRAGPADVYSGPAQMAQYMLKDNPELFDSSVDEQLEALASQKEQEEKQKTELAKQTANQTAEKSTLVLRQRTEEIRRNERLLVAMELMYLKVCNMFKQLKVPMIPTMKGGGDIKFGAIDLTGLTTNVYTGEALELVKEQLYKIIGGQAMTAPVAVLRIPLFEAGQVYAMSALFGYSLRNFDKRFQLEKMAGSFGAWGEPDPGSAQTSFQQDTNSGQSLKDYISSFGPEVLQNMISVSSIEARKAMELQVSSLFGDLGVLKEKFVTALGTVSSQQEFASKLADAIQSNEVETMRITSEDMTRLVLEAVAFGTLLNDSEKQVEAIYQLTPGASGPSGPANPFLPGGGGGNADDEPPGLPGR